MAMRISNFEIVFPERNEVANFNVNAEFNYLGGGDQSQGCGRI